MAWLTAPGSLTARLMAHGPVTVQRCRQGTARFTAQERRVLGACSGHVREVVLSVAGQPAVWARSATLTRGLKGPWKAIRGLGTRPLAELLFSHARVLRGPLVQHAWRRGSPEQRRACADLAASDTLGRVSSRTPPRWARASVFSHQGQPLRVMEAFLPHVSHWRP
jgi:chorismate--pyruvate lyase